MIWTTEKPMIVFVGQTFLGQTLSIKRFVVEYIGNEKLKASEKELGDDLEGSSEVQTEAAFDFNRLSMD